MPTLESIKASGNDSGDCLREVLKEILEGKGCDVVTKSLLIDALEANTVAFPQLANMLRRKYGITLAGTLLKLKNKTVVLSNT